MKWVDGTDLGQWADRIDSRALLPEVVRRLIFATVPDLQRVEFRSGEGVQLPGWDGYAETPTGTEKVPAASRFGNWVLLLTRVRRLKMITRSGHLTPSGLILRQLPTSL